MFLPQLPYGSAKNTRQIINFRGVRYGRGGSDGELAESYNLSSGQFPALSQRRARATVGTWEAPTAIFGKGKLCVVDGTDFIYDGEKVGAVTAGEKQIVSINTKIVIWPDKKVYDTEAKTFKDVGAKITASSVTFTDNSIAIPGQKLTELFAENQAVEISGSSISENNKSIVIRSVSDTVLTFYNNSFTAGQSTSEVTIEREVPDLKLICASNNRVWGCDDTTIWASALGDPYTWYNYDGLSTDSYAVAVGSDGAFTGCCAYGSNVLFWKEDVLHKVLGLQPSEYQIYTYTVQGPKQGCQKSLQIINEVLYYLGVEGVYAYSGGTPCLISENFGIRRFQSASAGTDGGITSPCRTQKRKNGACGPMTQFRQSGCVKMKPMLLISPRSTVICCFFPGKAPIKQTSRTARRKNRLNGAPRFIQWMRQSTTVRAIPNCISGWSLTPAHGSSWRSRKISLLGCSVEWSMVSGGERKPSP